ncbi:hypothetical protein FA13DRAFT_1714230 [Coprinellus micaceus]|uniref:Uncharacterized protein n=1 Tax=Coprinellus micaceus TaxID=71717 RepID=A0A4Y7STJ3_COPMI|nr:hypothetical protein FA13DRAFT_1714230 [Coprinellus micaceus]
MNSSRVAHCKQSPIPSVILAHFLRQIQAHHCRTPGRQPVPLHYDSTTQSLKEFYWPYNIETGQRIPPSMLESYRRTHHFRAPSCLFEVARGDADGNHDSILNGQYVAVCERRRCGYSLCLEKFYMLSGIKVEACEKRETPLRPQELNYMSDLSGPTPPKGQAGLRQVISEPAIRGRGRFMFPQIKPEVPKTAKKALIHSLVHGMNEDLFWDTFVQCFVCKDIMLRLGMFAAHRCQVDTGAANPRSSTRSPRNSRSLIRPHLLSIPGDIPEVRPLRSMSRFSSPLLPRSYPTQRPVLQTMERLGQALPDSQKLTVSEHTTGDDHGHTLEYRRSNKSWMSSSKRPSKPVSKLRLDTSFVGWGAAASADAQAVTWRAKNQSYPGRVHGGEVQAVRGAEANRSDGKAARVGVGEAKNQQSRRKDGRVSQVHLR